MSQWKPRRSSMSSNTASCSMSAASSSTRFSKFGCEMCSLIYFPCFITYFCRRVRIAATSDEGALEAPKSDISKKAYNHLCTHHGLPNLPTEGRRYKNRGRGAAAHRAFGEKQVQIALTIASFKRKIPPENEASPSINTSSQPHPPSSSQTSPHSARESFWFRQKTPANDEYPTYKPNYAGSIEHFLPHVGMIVL
ncbi:hypothetical protein L6452_08273 [Arctium lappa]|uniref:Uncharacterized protein n=1 Tax=Arctium lappa TaxID=4217 RepID=A0ACB9DH44_ARCLA|nr:hypothetical protein L6452_08273 [Arctium lappa]